MRLIDADSLKEAIEEQRKSKVYSEADERQNVIIDCILYIIDNALTVNINQPAIWWNGYDTGKVIGEHKRPTGKWIFHKDYNERKYGCNKCGNLNNIPSNFCPNCGAKMDRILP